MYKKTYFNLESRELFLDENNYIFYESESQDQLSFSERPNQLRIVFEQLIEPTIEFSHQKVPKASTVRNLSDPYEFLDLERDELNSEKSLAQSASQVIQQDSPPKRKKANLPKFIFRLFKKYFHRYEHKLRNTPDLATQITKRLQEIADSERQQPSKNFIKIAHLSQLFSSGGDRRFKHKSYVCRRIMSNIIKIFCKKEINESHHLQAKQLYLNSLKVYQLRCLNEKIASRLQSGCVL